MPGSQIIGRSTAFTPTGADNNVAYATYETAVEDGFITSITAYFNAAGTLALRTGTRANTTFTPRSARVVLTATGAGTKTFTAGVDFAANALPMLQGDCVAFYSGGKVSRDTAGNTRAFLMFFADPTGNSTPTVADTATSTCPQVGFQLTLSNRSNGTRVGYLGDSTFADWPSGLGLVRVSSLVTGTTGTAYDLSQPGHAIIDQTTAWQSANTMPKGALEAVVIQLPRNNINGAGTAFGNGTLSALQGLYNLVRSDVGPSCKIIAMPPDPCARSLFVEQGATNGVVAYQQWLDIRDAHLGVGPHPLTNVDARVISHLTTLAASIDIAEDGTSTPQPDCLAALYDTGDGKHVNNLGKQVKADAIKVLLTSLGM